MPRIEIDLNPVNTITTDAIGQPGQRVFYIQGRNDEQVITLVVEKVQIQTLALGVEDFITELAQKFPDLTEATADFDERDMHIQPPVDPLFRVGELGLAYDATEDMLILVAREISLRVEENEEEGQGRGPLEEDELSVVRFWCTRSQMRALCRWGLEITARGRPICPYCGQPMDPSGHFCPKRNGHKH